MHLRTWGTHFSLTNTREKQMVYFLYYSMNLTPSPQMTSLLIATQGSSLFRHSPTLTMVQGQHEMHWTKKPYRLSNEQLREQKEVFLQPHSFWPFLFKGSKWKPASEGQGGHGARRMPVLLAWHSTQWYSWQLTSCHDCNKEYYLWNSRLTKGNIRATFMEGKKNTHVSGGLLTCPSCHSGLRMGPERQHNSLAILLPSAISLPYGHMILTRNGLRNVQWSSHGKCILRWR